MEIRMLFPFFHLRKQGEMVLLTFFYLWRARGSRGLISLHESDVGLVFSEIHPESEAPDIGGACAA